MEDEARAEIAAETERRRLSQERDAAARVAGIAECRPLLLELMQYLRKQGEVPAPAFREVRKAGRWTDTDDYLGLGWFVSVGWDEGEARGGERFVLMVDGEVKGAGLEPTRRLDRQERRRFGLKKGERTLRARDELPVLHPSELREGIVDLMKRRANRS